VGKPQKEAANPAILTRLSYRLSQTLQFRLGWSAEKAKPRPSFDDLTIQPYLKYNTLLPSHDTSQRGVAAIASAARRRHSALSCQPEEAATYTRAIQCCGVFL
jgi:hypothetical protein